MHMNKKLLENFGKFFYPPSHLEFKIWISNSSIHGKDTFHLASRSHWNDPGDSLFDSIQRRTFNLKASSCLNQTGKRNKMVLRKQFFSQILTFHRKVSNSNSPAMVTHHWWVLFWSAKGALENLQSCNCIRIVLMNCHKKEATITRN